MSLADELLADLEEAAEEDEQEQLQEMMRIKAEQDIKEELEDEPMPEVKGIHFLANFQTSFSTVVLNHIRILIKYEYCTILQ